ncbi:MAG: glycosyltransferase family A protein, partial [Caldisericia bacterium]
MPTYNDKDTIRDSISSLYQQDYDNWELIIINDG